MFLQMRNSANSQLQQLYKSSAKATGEPGRTPHPTAHPGMAGGPEEMREVVGPQSRGSTSIGSAAQEAGAVPVPPTRNDNALEEAVDSSNRLNWHLVPPTAPAMALGNLQKTTATEPAMTTPTGPATLTTPTAPVVGQVTTPTAQGTGLSVAPQAVSPAGVCFVDYTASLEATPTHSDSSAPSTDSKQATPTGLHSILKKVKFSTPEVTEQHQFEAESGSGCGPDDTGHVTSHSRARKAKKRHRHHEGDPGGKGEGESATVKRRKVKEGGEGSAKDMLGQTRSAGTYVL